LAYRDGNWEQTPKWCQESREKNKNSTRTTTTVLYDAHNLVLEAMALHQQGNWVGTLDPQAAALRVPQSFTVPLHATAQLERPGLAVVRGRVAFRQPGNHLRRVVDPAKQPVVEVDA
jgi:hypothetical protein